jgi:hypothetical protein
MTTASPTQPLTTVAFLFDGTDDSVDALAHTLSQQGVLGAAGTAMQRVSQAGRDAAGSEITAVAHGLLDLDLGDLVVAGWRKHAAFTTAVERTRATPGSSEVVELASHRITAVYQPFVEVLINDVHVATIRFELGIEFLVQALVVTIHDGHLVSLRAGTCEVTGTLSAEGTQLASRQEHFELPLLIRLPLRIHPDGDSSRYATGSPSEIIRSMRLSMLATHGIRRQRRRPLVGQGPPAD